MPGFVCLRQHSNLQFCPCSMSFFLFEMTLKKFSLASYFLSSHFFLILNSLNAINSVLGNSEAIYEKINIFDYIKHF